MKIILLYTYNEYNVICQLHLNWDFPGSPVVRTSPSNAGSEGSIPDLEAKIPHAS